MPGTGFREGLQEHAREAGAEVRAVDDTVPAGLGDVEILAAGTEELDAVDARDVVQAHGQERLVVAVHSGAPAKVRSLVLLQHLLQAFHGDDVARVDEPVELPRVGLELLQAGARHRFDDAVLELVHHVLDHGRELGHGLLQVD